MENQGRCGKKLNSTASHWIVGWHWVGLGAPGSCSVFHEWSKMVIIPFCRFLPRSRKTSTYEDQGQIWSPKPCLNHETRIETIFMPISEQACALWDPSGAIIA